MEIILVSEAQVCNMSEREVKRRNYKCVICGVDIYVKPHRLLKENFGFTCSRECSSKIRGIKTKGSGNHQYCRCPGLAAAGCGRAAAGTCARGGVGLRGRADYFGSAARQRGRHCSVYGPGVQSCRGAP